ncbi:anthranilate synthase component II [Hymenobacter siberiensis]|jgi:anthranilate synthase/aminodeoxychorismate synthase-like glutamine amidotransferase|uniref:anthranilate synthase component II n=1 Tax=Hymenobacter siberiensis TaxID=2848396 RepID=UPI001C1E1CBA|nr:aminodeoxychorismate/anthranilate synthase component II [Hymenobacter siberiensis]MBU6119368.1 aminodeoxychorismate/anthranilate synthase component II [Hymenobacter siberiensis]
MRLLLLDNFDSFTFTLADYLRQLGAEVVVRRNDVPLVELNVPDFDGLVLSPGPGTPAAAGVMPAVIQTFHRHIPMLGVCLGHQALGEFFGGAVVRAARPMHGKVTDMRCDTAAPLFAGLPVVQSITRYHSLILSEPLPAVLQPLAYTTGPAPELMALRHRTLPLYGVQFHPEALLTPHGLAILGNWLRCCIIA